MIGQYSSLVLAVVCVIVLLMLKSWQKTHPLFDLSDLVTGDNGKVSGSKFCQMGAWSVSTWGFATMIDQGKMTEYYFIGYMTVWAGYAGWKASTSASATASSTSTSITATTTN